MAASPEAAALHITVAWASGPRQVQQARLHLPAGSTVAQAVQASGLLADLDEATRASLGYGIWGRRASADTPLQEGDRIEICRPLLADPKQARRARFANQGARSAGLFARRRPGGKAGY